MTGQRDQMGEPETAAHTYVRPRNDSPNEHTRQQGQPCAQDECTVTDAAAPQRAHADARASVQCIWPCGTPSWTRGGRAAELLGEKLQARADSCRGQSDCDVGRCAKQGRAAAGRRRQFGNQRGRGGRKCDVPSRLQDAQPKEEKRAGCEAHQGRAGGKCGRSEQDNWPAAQTIVDRAGQRASKKRSNAKGPQDEAYLPVRQAYGLQVEGNRYQEGVERAEEKQVADQTVQYLLTVGACAPRCCCL